MWEYTVTKKDIQTKFGLRIEARVWQTGAGKNRAKPKTKRFATISALRAFVESLNNGTEKVKRRGESWMTVGEIFTEYLNLSTNTAVYLGNVKELWELLGPMVGNLPADKITKLYLRTLERDLKALPARKSKHGKELRKPGQRTINIKVGFVRTLINFAHEHGLILHNPIGAKFKVTKAEETEADFWDLEEANKFMTYVRQKYTPGSPKHWVYVLYQLAINSGIRSGEMWALRPSCLRESSSQIYISEQWVNKKGEKGFRHTKGKARRLVPLNDDLLKELRLLAQTRKPNDLFFPSSTGTPMDHKNFRERYFIRDLQAAGLRYIKFHGLRGTAATLMLSMGVNVRVVQRILGHKSLSVTMKYVKALGADIAAVGRIFSITGAAPEGAKVTPIATKQGIKR